MVDIKMNDEWQLTPAANGDAPVTGETEGLLQTIKIEAMTQEGELFYDADFGWSLMDFIQAQDTELTRIEIEARIRQKLEKYEEIVADSITILQKWSPDALTVSVRFLLTDGTGQGIVVSLDRVEVTV